MNEEQPGGTGRVRKLPLSQELWERMQPIDFGNVYKWDMICEAVGLARHDPALPFLTMAVAGRVKDELGMVMSEEGMNQTGFRIRHAGEISKWMDNRSARAESMLKQAAHVGEMTAANPKAELSPDERRRLSAKSSRLSITAAVVHRRAELEAARPQLRRKALPKAEPAAAEGGTMDAAAGTN